MVCDLINDKNDDTLTHIRTTDVTGQVIVNHSGLVLIT